ncbi:MAG TPA: hypothetical protein VHE30_13785 [Polyangiaceae bacterium]|nr:hypothetical protein [Polyangiaceae bacterium]
MRILFRALGIAAFAFGCASENDSSSTQGQGGPSAGGLAGANGGDSNGNGGFSAGSGGGAPGNGGFSPGNGGFTPGNGGFSPGNGGFSPGSGGFTPGNGGFSPGNGGSGTGGGGSACTGRPGTLSGKSNQTITVGAIQRTFVYYVPAGLDPNTPAPIVIVPHGFTMSGEAMFDITQYSKIADREKFVAIFPDGEPGSLGPWNVGVGICGAGAFVGGAGDDQSFVDAMIDFVDKDRCADRDHVFITGFSMGGYFSNETACMNPHVRAGGPHSGGTHDLSTCKNAHRPMIIFHFKSDSLISYTCGTDARDKWVAKNGCTAANPDVTTVKGGTCEYYKGCPADGQVALCSFDEPPGGDGEVPTGHAWSGGSKAGPLGAASTISVTESAAELGWAFFKKYAW